MIEDVPDTTPKEVRKDKVAPLLLNHWILDCREPDATRTFHIGTILVRYGVPVETFSRPISDSRETWSPFATWPSIPVDISIYINEGWTRKIPVELKCSTQNLREIHYFWSLADCAILTVWSGRLKLICLLKLSPTVSRNEVQDEVVVLLELCARSLFAARNIRRMFQTNLLMKLVNINKYHRPLACTYFYSCTL